MVSHIWRILVSLVVIWGSLAGSLQAGLEFEMGRITVANTFGGAPAATTVTFAQPFETTPVVVSLPTTQGSDPAALRIRNVTKTGFEIVIAEPLPRDGPHAAMTNVGFLAVEPGRVTGPGGFIVEAGYWSTKTTTQAGHAFNNNWGGYDTVSLSAGFSGTPAIFADNQTMNNETKNPGKDPSVPWLTTSIRNATASSFQVALDRAEVNDGTDVIQEEKIGWIAVTPTVGDLAAVTNGNATGLFDVFTFDDPNVILGWNNVWGEVAFNQTFTSAPTVVASLASRRGGDGGWLRRGSVTNSSVQLVVDEDTFSDSERGHTWETASVFAFDLGGAGRLHSSFVPEPSTFAVWGALALVAVVGGWRRQPRNKLLR